MGLCHNRELRRRAISNRLEDKPKSYTGIRLKLPASNDRKKHSNGGFAVDNRANFVSTLESTLNTFNVPKVETPLSLTVLDGLKVELPDPLVTHDLWELSAFDNPKVETPFSLTVLDGLKFELPDPLVSAVSLVNLDLGLPGPFDVPEFELPDTLVNHDLWAMSTFNIPKVETPVSLVTLETGILETLDGPKNVRSHSDVLDRFDRQVTFAGLVECTRHLFADGYYSLAVEKAYVYLENLVKQQSGLSGKYGADLMRQAFSAKSPRIKLNAGETDSDKDEQRGYMEVFAGVISGIRNPRAHSHDWVDPPEEALELVTFANHLVRRISISTVSRNVN